MIYLDNGATTLQKPATVYRAVERAMIYCANPGRSGHEAALRAANEVYECRQCVSDFFHLDAPERVIFTQNATHALNIAIKSILHNGGHAVISGYEHNSVARPLEMMKERGVQYTIAESPLFQPEAAYKAIYESICEDTTCVIITHVSNVFGFILPIEKIDALCQRRGIPLIIDASQSAGILPLDVTKLQGTAFICMPGHKALYGPQGTGVLLCCKDMKLYSLTEGGTGSSSLDLHQPEFLPDQLESGTLNVPGIAGLREGVRFVAKQRTAILEQEHTLLEKLAEGLSVIPDMEVFYQPECQSGVLSFRPTKQDPDWLCQLLTERRFCLRSGLHCSPLAHRSAGTLPAGTIRASFSAFNTPGQVEQLLCAVHQILK